MGRIRRSREGCAIYRRTSDLGTFDVITSDLPFGMHISKGEDLDALYSAFLEYSAEKLHSSGTLVAYTSEHELLHKKIQKSAFVIDRILELQLSTSIDVYLYPKIFVCKLQK